MTVRMRPATVRLSGDTERLRQVAIFAGVDAPALDTIAATARHRTYTRGDMIRTGDGASADIVVVVRGSAALSRLADSDREILLALVRPGDIFGFVYAEACVLDAETAAYHLPYAAVRRLMDVYPRVNAYVHDLLCRNVEHERRWRVKASCDDATTHLAHLLAGLVADDGQDVLFVQEDLGAFVGARQEKMSLALDALRAGGLVECRRGAVVVLDRAGLAAYRQQDRRQNMPKYAPTHRKARG